jgi:ubiquinone/menaquinone biosynthesis C-methylase UbiE
MNHLERIQHWENVYHTKSPNEVSWTQVVPKLSLHYIQSYNLAKEASIIDVGGGDSTLVDFLLEQGFENISVLDISKKSIQKAKERLGNKAKKIQWINTDILKFKPNQNYDLWHDRAAFHFLTLPNQIKKYIALANNVVNKNMLIACFSKDGPAKCSGLTIKQYSANDLELLFYQNFQKIHHQTQNHQTPFNTEQNFLYCSFKKK